MTNKQLDHTAIDPITGKKKTNKQTNKQKLHTQVHYSETGHKIASCGSQWAGIN